MNSNEIKETINRYKKQCSNKDGSYKAGEGTAWAEGVIHGLDSRLK